MTPRFPPDVHRSLGERGWQVVEVPAAISLAGLRDAGAPFKGTKYFQQQAARTGELPVPEGEVAYRPGLLPESLNQTYERSRALLAAVQAELPPGTRAEIGPAALYVWLFVEHHRRHGAWPLNQQYAWAADHSAGIHLAVGVFGQQRPLLVSLVPEGLGRGVGLMPLVFPQ
ncbi:MAG TPA: hypothetical protein VHS99_15000 [Chloroflexota bacterium]|jgi:hypothetical protein|nr:hypothetical protein [Chloroflexota bacterium]